MKPGERETDCSRTGQLAPLVEGGPEVIHTRPRGLSDVRRLENSLLTLNPRPETLDKNDSHVGKGGQGLESLT